MRLVTDKLSQKANQLGVANQRLAALIQLNLQLASQPDPVRSLDEVCRGARELIGARYAALGIKSKETDRTAHFVTSGINAETAAEFGIPSLDEGVLGTVTADRCTRRLTELIEGAPTLGLPAGFPPVHSFLAAPLISLTTVYGWICLTENLGAGEFSDDDETLLTMLAAQFGRIYENSTLYAAAHRHAADLQREIAGRKVVEQRLQESEAKSCRIAVEHGGFTVAWIGLVDKDTLKIKPEASAGHNDDSLENIASLVLDEGTLQVPGAAEQALRTKAAMVINDFGTLPHTVHRKEELEPGYRSGVVLPLIIGEKAVGDRRADFAGRLRHGLFQLELSQGLSHRYRQDRQVICE